jgi:hypothetical protein
MSNVANKKLNWFASKERLFLEEEEDRNVNGI